MNPMEIKVGKKYFVVDRSSPTSTYTIVDTEPQCLTYGTLIEWDGSKGKLSINKRKNNTIVEVTGNELKYNYMGFDEYKMRANDISYHLKVNASKVEEME